MAKSRKQKEIELTELLNLLRSSKATVFSTYSGLSVQELERLRRELLQAQGRYLVPKKKLLELAARQVQLNFGPVLGERVPISVAFGLGDEVAPAKVLSAFAKDHEQVRFLGGFVGQIYYQPDQLKQLASLPSRLELLAKVVGSLRSPLVGLVNVLQGNLRGLVQALNAIREQRANVHQ